MRRTAVPAAACRGPGVLEQHVGYKFPPPVVPLKPEPTMHLHQSRRRSAAILYVCTAMCAAFLAFATVPSSAGASESVIENSVVVNGVVKAHGVFYTNGNTFCTNMLNASGNGNWPYSGPWASTG